MDNNNINLTEILIFCLLSGNVKSLGLQRVLKSVVHHVKKLKTYDDDIKFQKRKKDPCL